MQHETLVSDLGIAQQHFQQDHMQTVSLHDTGAAKCFASVTSAVVIEKHRETGGSGHRLPAPPLLPGAVCAR